MKMMIAILGSLVAAIFLVGCMNSVDAWKEEAKVIHVGGKVLCQDCTHGWNEWVEGDKPIKKSKVCVTCIDDKRRRVMYYGSDLTDERGQFDLIINKTIRGKELKPELCSVRLVSSPDSVCNILTDFSGGKSGVKLSRPCTVERDLIKYTLEPFYFTTPMCDEPDTTEFADEHANKY